MKLMVEFIFKIQNRYSAPYTGTLVSLFQMHTYSFIGLVKHQWSNAKVLTRSLEMDKLVTLIILFLPKVSDWINLLRLYP